DRSHDPIARPVGAQPLRPDEGVEAIPGMFDTGRRDWGAKARKFLQGLCQNGSILHALPVPFRQPRQLDEPDGSLDFQHSVIGAETLVQPAEAGRVALAEHRIIGLAVVLAAPRATPQPPVVHDKEPTLASGRQDLVLAEREAGHIAEAPDGPATVG